MKYISFLFTVILFHAANAQTLQVKNISTLEPISGAMIYEGEILLGKTDASGSISIQLKPAQIISISAAGYETKNISYEELNTSSFIVALKEFSIDLNTIVISATRFPQKELTSSQEIITINSQKIAFENTVSSADLLQNSGEVLVQKSQFGGGSPMMRGFEASRILLVVDGVRMNNAIYRAGHLQNIITMDQSILASVELAFGPSSVAYGSDALGGLIQFRTKNPLLKNSTGKTVSGNAFARYGTAASEKTAHLDLNLALSKFASLTSFTFSDFGDLKAGSVANADGKYGSFGFRPIYSEFIDGKDSTIINSDSTKQIQTAYSQYDILQKFLYQQNEHTSHVLNFQYSNSSDIPRYDRLTETADGVLRYGDWYYGPQERLLAAYQFNHHQSDSKLYDDVLLTASYQSIEESRHSRRYGKSGITHRTENVSVFGVSADFKKTIQQNNLNYGIEAYFNDVNSVAESENIETAEISAASTRYPDGGSTMNNAAIFASHQITFADGHLILNDGLRFNLSALHASFIDTTFYPFPFSEVQQNNQALTGSIGLIYLSADDLKISLNGSTGFRSPNIDDLAKVFDSEPGSVLMPNEDLKPEYTYNADLSISKIFADKVEFHATGFYTIFKNYFTIEPGTFEGNDSIEYDGLLSQVLTTTNTTQAYISGLNAGFTAQLPANLSLFAQATFTYGRIKTDSVPYPLDHIPPFYGKAGLSYQVNKFKAEFYSLFNGWKHIEDYNIVAGEDNEQYATADGMPSWYTLNLKAAYTITPLLQIQAGCENILDLNYRVFASGISAPGRNIYLTLRSRF